MNPFHPVTGVDPSGFRPVRILRQPGAQSSRGFRLPEGDVEKGRDAFTVLQCHSCHEVEGVEGLPQPTSFNLVLGGETTRVKTYGELVTSIINPSHIISPEYQEQLLKGDLSPMPEYNHTMNVGQMIDLVAFLDSRYEVVYPEYTRVAYP